MNINITVVNKTQEKTVNTSNCRKTSNAIKSNNNPANGGGKLQSQIPQQCNKGKTVLSKKKKKEIANDLTVEDLTSLLLQKLNTGENGSGTSGGTLGKGRGRGGSAANRNSITGNSNKRGGYQNQSQRNPIPPSPANTNNPQQKFQPNDEDTITFSTQHCQQNSHRGGSNNRGRYQNQRQRSPPPPYSPSPAKTNNPQQRPRQQNSYRGGRRRQRTRENDTEEEEGCTLQ